MCRNCYQPVRMHDKKPDTMPPPPSPGAGGKADAKVFQRFRVNREQGIDHSVPPKERTPQPQKLEGITSGKVAGIVGNPPSVQGKSPSPTPLQKSVSPSPSASLPKPQPPAIVYSGGPPSNRLNPSPPVVAMTTNLTSPTAPSPPQVAEATIPVTPSGTKLPSRPPPPSSTIRKPPPPATISSNRGPSPTSVTQPSRDPAPTPSSEGVLTPQPADRETGVEPSSANNSETEATQEVKVERGETGNVADGVKTQETQQPPQEGAAVVATPQEPEAAVGISVRQGHVGDVPVSQLQAAEVGAEKRELSFEQPPVSEALKQVDNTVSETGTGTSNGDSETVLKDREAEDIHIAKVEEVMEIVEVSAAPALESSIMSLDLASTGEGGDQITEVGREQNAREDAQVAIEVSSPDDSLAVVTEVVEVQVQERDESGGNLEEHLKHAASKMAEQTTEDQLHTTQSDTPEEEATKEEGYEEDEKEEGYEEDEEEGVTNDEPDGVVDHEEGTDGGKEMVKSIKKRLSFKRKPKRKATEKTEDGNPVPQQGEYIDSLLYMAMIHNIIDPSGML